MGNGPEQRVLGGSRGGGGEGGSRGGQKQAIFGGFSGRKSAHLNTPLGGVLRPVGSLSTPKKVKKGPRGAVFSLFSKISPPLCQK